MSSTASAPVLPRHIDPRKFAKQGVNIEGNIDLKALDRIRPLLASDDGEVYAQLVFGVDEQGIRNLTGHATANVEMVCQRCLDSSPQLLDMTLNLAMIWSDDKAENLPKPWEPWIVGEGQTDIYQVIEDELILSLPIVAYHSEVCVSEELFNSAPSATDESEAADGEQEAKKPNPFQVLEQLKGSLKDESDN